MSDVRLQFTMPHNVARLVPRIDDYFGLWSIHEPVFVQVVERLQGLDLLSHINSDAAKQAIATQSETLYPVDQNGIATFAVRGPTMKTVSSLSGGTSSVRLRQQIRAAMNDPEVLGAMLILDTPGGTVAGNADLANEVARFAASKPIYAFVEDLAASAAVAVASHATKRFANSPDALYGSMGTYSVLTDQSKVADKLGVKVHVIRAGEHKGSGTPGTEITPEQLAEAQRIVDRLNAEYVGLIARGLGKTNEEIAALADGRIHPAQDAVAMGLLNGVQSFDATRSQLVADIAARRASVKRGFPMSSTEKTPATLAELKRTFPNSSAEWRESQLEAGASLADAGAAYAVFLEQKLAAAEADATKRVEAAREEGRQSRPSLSLGHQPLRGKQAAADDEGADPVAEFNAEVARLGGGGGKGVQSRFDAIRRIAKTNPSLYASYLRATNPKSGKIRRQLDEKLESVLG